MPDFPTQWPALVFVGMMVVFMAVLLFCSISEWNRD